MFIDHTELCTGALDEVLQSGNGPRPLRWGQHREPLGPSTLDRGRYP